MDRQSKRFYIILAVMILVIAALVVFIVMKLREDDGANNGSGPDANTGIVELVVEAGEVVHKPVEDFDAYVEAAGKPVFVDFWASWCGPCVSAAPFVESLAKEYDGRAHVLKVDVDIAGDLARRFGASSIPLFVMINDGSKVDSYTGYADRIEDDIRAMVENQLDA